MYTLKFRIKNTPETEKLLPAVDAWLIGCLHENFKWLWENKIINVNEGIYDQLWDCYFVPIDIYEEPNVVDHVKQCLEICPLFASYFIGITFMSN